MRIVTIVGARPQFIKAAAVSRAIKDTKDVTEVLVHTGQHYDANMSKIFFDELEIPEPQYNLEIGGGTHGAMTGRMLEKIEEVLLKEKPDAVLVYGDTNSTLAGALAAAKLHIPVAHIEAGLRSFNKKMPEETNRVLADHVSSWLFCPTQVAVKNLGNEGITKNVHLVGDVMYDAFLYFVEKGKGQSHVLESLKLKPGEYVLSTIHRAENTDNHERLRVIFNALSAVAEEIPVIFPIHPRTRQIAQKLNLNGFEKVRFIDPVGYLDMAQLEKNARVIATDSGGVQKEAYFSRVPCVTLRNETEWTELVDMGWNTIMRLNSAEAIARTILRITPPEKTPSNVYGEGHSAGSILKILIS